MAFMKKALPFLLLLLSACVSQRPAINNFDVLKAHTAPLKVSNIGYWDQHFSVLTLLDAKNQYFTIRTARNDSVKIGDVYRINN